MGLVNLQFALLCIKLAIGVVPFAFGVYLIVMEEEKRRALRTWFCGRALGVGNAIPHKDFARAMTIFGSVLILFGALAIWFLVVQDMIE